MATPLLDQVATAGKLALALLACGLSHLPGQEPSSALGDFRELHATLCGWAERMWFKVLDRDGARWGRLSDAGILQRFQPDIAASYQLDLMSSSFRLYEEYEWCQRPNGVRYWAASVNRLDLVAHTDVKARVRIVKHWDGGFSVNKEETYEAKRSLVQVSARRSWDGGVYAVLGSTLQARKPSDAVWVGAGVSGARRDIGVTVTMLNTFSNFIYQGLGVYKGYADTALDYETFPVAVVTTFDLPIGQHVRVEGHAAWMPPNTLRVYRQVAPDSGFRQGEVFTMGGGLVEWTLARSTQVGGFGTYVRARTLRTRLPLGRTVDDFMLTERTSHLGAFALSQLTKRWQLEAWAGRIYRPERRVYQDTTGLDVDYEDRSWSGQVVARYGRLTGVLAELALEWDYRTVVRGNGQVSAGEFLGRNNARFRTAFGWRFANAGLQLGFGIDLDGDLYKGTRKIFDGGQGRALIYW